MSTLDEDLNESDLFCKSLIQKRKATESNNIKSKQLKLNFNPTSNEANKEQSKGYNSAGGKFKGNKVQNWNSSCNESQSGYFNMKKSMNTCPLCLKTFKTDSGYSGHMKHCAKAHKMTTQQLLGALELQKKQMQERRILGLSSQITLLEKKSAPKKRIEKDRESYDLALGLALSESLITDRAKTEALAEAPKSTLQGFGFTSSSTAAGVPGSSKRKNEYNKKSLLRERTPEDRQRIIIEKVAVVLLDEGKIPQVENNVPSPTSALESVQVPQLWNKGENNCKSGWYVSGIKNLVLLDENNKEEEEEVTESVPDNIENEIRKLNLPRRDVSNDWRKIINNKKLSDLVGTTRDGQDVHVHSVVLHARCPELLEKDCKSIFEKFNLSTILIFIEYIYCGTLNGLFRTEVDGLFNLAREFDYKELIEILTCLRGSLSSGFSTNDSSDVKHEGKNQERPAVESEKLELVQNEDLLVIEEDQANLTPARQGSEDEGTGDSSNTDKSYWSFIQQQKKTEKIEEFGGLQKGEVSANAQSQEEKVELKSPRESDKTNGIRRPSDDSTTKDWDDLFGEGKSKNFSDCVILSSGSETSREENFIKTQRLPSRTPTPVDMNYEVPLYDPYENFHCFPEEPFSPVEPHSQSLITGDISVESPRESPRRVEGCGQDEPNKGIGYCSTPVTIRESSKVGASTKRSAGKGRRKCDPSSSNLLRKSLGLRQRISKPGSCKKKRKVKKSLAEALTNSVLNELSRCSALESSPPAGKDFIEITPISNREEFGDCVTPSPNYSNMGETLLKEQLTKYGLKKNLAKSKAKKILRLIYEELHPLYNTETGKIVKMVPENTSKAAKKSKAKGKSQKEKNGKPKQTKNQSSGKKVKRSLDSSREKGNSSDGSILSLDRSSSDCGSKESDFESLNETLTQSMPANPVDLSSAFCEFLQNNPEYHQKILLFEPIWIEDLQKRLKENFKKHFKMSDLMDFLDQKCISFRSAAQAKKLQKRNEKRKENSRKKKISSKENSS